MTGRHTVAVLAAVLAPAIALAQGVQSELRIDALAARTAATHVGVGANIVAGTYARIAMLGGAGVRRVDDTWRSSGRIDLVARVHVDPLRQFVWGAYAGGGGTWLFDEDAESRARLLVVVGYEGPATESGWIAGIELGVGGGVRLAITARRARPVGR